MSPAEVPDALVEKAARARYDSDPAVREGDIPPWDTDPNPFLDDTDRDEERDDARHALAAVLPEIQAQVRRAVADEISSDAMSSDFLHDHVSDAGITWFVREIRESAEEIDGRHVHTWSPARGVYGVGEHPPLECACGDRATRLITTTDGPTT